MFSAFHMGPTASGRRLCVIERVLFRFKITCQKIVPASRNYIDYNLSKVIVQGAQFYGT